MRICLVNPLFGESIWGFNRIQRITGTRYSLPPLGLPTVAALTPPEHEVEIIDENVEELDFDREYDLVGITSFNVQLDRAFEIAGEYRRRGVRVVMGGPYATLAPEECLPHVDHLLAGEAEYTWPRFLEDLEAGEARPLYQQAGNVPIADSPVPRFDLLRIRRYGAIPVQTSRGCPYECEFCDVPVTMGRRPRIKSAEQVLEEVEAIHRLGGNTVLFTDDNFIGNRKRAKEILLGLRDFRRNGGRTMTFRAEMTLNVAQDEELLDLLGETRFESIFVGIETPRAESLREAGKHHNTRRPMIEDVRKIQSRGIMVWAGMIVGFDHDDTDIFREQLDFLTEANVPVTTTGVLVAIPKTALHDRLGREERLLPWNKKEVQGHLGGIVNFAPLLMTREQLESGYRWLVRSLYSRKNYVKRLLGNLELFPRLRKGGSHLPTLREVRGWIRDLRVLGRIFREFLVRGDNEMRGLFLRTLARAARLGPAPFVQALAYFVIFKHVHGVVRDNFGDPETVSARDPFHPASETSSPAAA